MRYYVINIHFLRDNNVKGYLKSVNSFQIRSVSSIDGEIKYFLKKSIISLIQQFQWTDYRFFKTILYNNIFLGQYFWHPLYQPLEPLEFLYLHLESIFKTDLNNW